MSCTEADDARSTDGEDTPGSLCDFIVDGDDESGDEGDQGVRGTRGDDDQLEFPYDASVLEAHMQESTGPRRSLRARRQVQRYQDENYRALMMDDVDEDGLESSEDDGNHGDDDDTSGSFDPGDDDADDDTDDDDADDDSDGGAEQGRDEKNADP